MRIFLRFLYVNCHFCAWHYSTHGSPRTSAKFQCAFWKKPDILIPEYDSGSLIPGTVNMSGWGDVGRNSFPLIEISEWKSYLSSSVCMYSLRNACFVGCFSVILFLCKTVVWLHCLQCRLIHCALYPLWAMLPDDNQQCWAMFESPNRCLFHDVIY